MPPRRPRPRLGLLLGLAAGLSCGALSQVVVALSAPTRVVLQKGRQYLPLDLFLRRGDTIVLHNGDEGALHRAFIEADRFAFDGGDQEPGAETRLTLSEPGDYVIRCGIHPKMKLTVHVQ